MGITNDEIQRLSAFYHALGKVLTEENNSIGGEKYKSAHNVKTDEVWVDTIAYSSTIAEAEAEAILNESVTMVGSTVSSARLYPLQGSNYQAWFLDTGSPSVSITGCVPSDGWVKPLINPSDVTNPQGEPSNGFLFKMYRPNGTEVNYLTTFWDVDYYAGIVKFQPNGTPGDGGNNLGFVTGPLTVGNTTNLTTLQAFLDTDGPRGLAFQYSGLFLDEYLNDLPTSEGGSVGGNGSEEWQSSVNGYLINVGNGLTVSGFTAINEQISFINGKYPDTGYFIKTDDDITGVTWSGINATNSYFEYNGSTFGSYSLSTDDDSNRFLLVDNSIVLDVIQISVTGSVTEFPSTTILEDRILEYTGTESSGWSYSAWQVTDPRLGMITTLDNKASALVRYVGVGTGWVEYQYESTYKVNSQKDIVAYTTTDDYDIAVEDVLAFEPSGDKTVDILLNGVEMPSDVYVFGNPGATTSITVDGFSSNELTIPNADAPIVGEYLNITSGSGTYIRQVLTVVAGATNSAVGYSGVTVPGVLSAEKFPIVQRTNRVARQGDYLLWVGSSWYQLTESDPKDLITFEYVTGDAGALNI